MERGKELTDFEFDENENKSMKDVIDKFKICRHFYKALYKSVTDNFFDLVSLLSFSRIEDVNKDIWLNGWRLKTDIKEYSGSTKLLKSLDYFYF